MQIFYLLGELFHTLVAASAGFKFVNKTVIHDMNEVKTAHFRSVGDILWTLWEPKKRGAMDADYGNMGTEFISAGLTKADCGGFYGVDTIVRTKSAFRH